MTLLFMPYLRSIFLVTLLFSVVIIDFESILQTNPESDISYSQKKEISNIDQFFDLASSHYEKEQYKEALTYFSKAYKIAKQLKDDKKSAAILNGMGLTYWRLDDNKAALDCYNLSIKITEKQKMEELQGIIHNNIALIEKEEGEYKKAIWNNEQSIKILKEINSYKSLGISYNTRGQIFKNQFKNDSALINYKVALKNYKAIDYKDGMAATYYNLSEIYTRENEKNKAISAAKKSLNIGLNIQRMVRIKDGYRRLSETYEHFNQPDSALLFHKKYTSLQLESLNQRLSEELIKERTRLGGEIQELKIKNLQKEKTIFRNRVGLIVGGILLFLSLVLFLGYRKFSKVQIHKKELEIRLENSQNILQVKTQELRSYIIDLSHKNELIKKLQKKITPTKESPELQYDQLLNQRIITREDWKKFQTKFKSLYPKFIPKIKMMNISITEAEIRLLVLLKLKLSGKEMAETLGISPQSVRVTKMRLKKKLQEEGYDSVEIFLQEL